MKIFYGKDLQGIDRNTIETEGIESIDLMERAASAVVYEITSRWQPSKHICIFAGPGNNGGDALAIARLLLVGGYHPEIFLFNVNRISENCTHNRDRLLEEFPDSDFNEVIREFHPPTLTTDTLVIDGLFGIGFNRPMMGGFKSLVEYINDSGAYVISLDIPSGLMSDWEQKSDSRCIVHAHETFSFQYPKLSFFFRENADYVGKYRILDIGLKPDTITEATSHFQSLEAADVAALIKSRDKFADKFNFGHALLAGGRYGMVGAISLASQAAMRTGVGLVTIHAPRCANIILQTTVPEALFEPDADDLVCSTLNINSRYNALGIGTGLGTGSKQVECMRNLLDDLQLPTVFDADALNIISRHHELLDLLPSGSIITPHVFEFERLFNCVIDSDSHRLQQAIAMAAEYRIIIVLKGAHTAIVSPRGDVYFNTTGNSGMATAGSGDVLTGIITSFLAQGYDPVEAAVLGVYLHGLAGDMAVADNCEESITAQDIIAHLGKAFKKLKSYSRL